MEEARTLKCKQCNYKPARKGNDPSNNQQQNCLPPAENVKPILQCIILCFAPGSKITPCVECEVHIGKFCSQF